MSVNDSLNIILSCYLYNVNASKKTILCYCFVTVHIPVNCNTVFVASHAAFARGFLNEDKTAVNSNSHEIPHRSFTTSEAMISPATDGTNATDPGTGLPVAAVSSVGH